MALRATHTPRLSARQLSLILLLLIGSLTSACSLTMAPDADRADSTPTRSASFGEGPPIVTLRSPTDGRVYAQGTTINIVARIDNVGENMERVQILRNGGILVDEPVATRADTITFSVEYQWPATETGAQTFEVVAIRPNGVRSAPSPVTITVQAGTTDPNNPNIAPTVPTATPSQTATDAPQPSNTPTMQPAATTQVPATTAAPTQADTSSQQPATATHTPTTTSTTSATDAPAAALVTNTQTAPAQPTATATSRPASAGGAFAQGTVLEAAMVRTGPGDNFAAVTSMFEGLQLRLFAVTPDGDWYKVQVGVNQFGWIEAALLDVINADDLPIESGN